MATFEIEESQSMRWVRIDLVDDDCRAERGAMSHMKGAVTMTVPLPTPHAMWVSLFSDESVLRPRYVGTGSVFLDSTLGGYHVFQVTPGERWILDTKCFWASDGEVSLRIHRERMLTALFAGQGLLWYKTALSGEGQVVLAVDGPVEEVELKDDRLLVDGPYVVAHTAGIRLRMKWPTKSFWSSWLSGQQRTFCYEGTGKLLLCTVPYWRRRMQLERAGTAAGAGA
jgi:uncharacterized protein (AIM24 family)